MKFKLLNSMHVLDIIAIVLIGLFAVLGATKGFVAAVFGFLSALLAVLVAGLLASELGEMIYGFSIFGSASIGEGLTEGLKGSLSEHGGFMTSVPEGGYNAQNVVQILGEVGIPTIIGALVAGPIAEAISPHANLPLVDVLSPVLAKILLSIISFILLYIIVWSVVQAIAKSAKRAIARTNFAKNTDALLGLVVGAIKGCVFLWIGLAFISLFSFVPWASELINSTAVVKWFADNNLLTLLITSGFDVSGTLKSITTQLYNA